MNYVIETNRKMMEQRFEKCAKGAAAHVIALLAGYGIPEDDLADAMDDIPRILTRALLSLQDDIEDCSGKYMSIIQEPDIQKPEALMTVMLDNFEPARKVNVIKVVREITRMGLKEAKDLVEGAPKPVKANISRDEAEALKKKLEEGGGKVSVVRCG